MSVRELLVLGTSSAVPTRRRNHNGYFLRFDDHGILIDPGEGTQRQMRTAGVSATDITRILITHFHGDHSLGLPGTIQRIARDQVPHTVRIAYPAQGQDHFDRLRHATAFVDTDRITAQPVGGHGACPTGEPNLHISALPLHHSVPTYGYRIAEPDTWRLDPHALAQHGITGPDAGHIKTHGHLTRPDGTTVHLEQVARPRPGQVVAHVMDTAPCPQAEELAAGADLLIIESTYLDSEEHLARAYGHLTARQAAGIAARAGVRHLVLTHISERYEHGDDQRFLDQAAQVYPGPTTLAADLDRIALPPRR
ncbi:ribonuclease Z [Nocardiopsis sp. HNM0947]|uniref:Ribonuclease Z n=1 Tax=Nocardiopsis coralli TaxID=2772213 RepID=A0ABR9PF07_9ACTN|nr:ribonuclease Z [Nocardiopsis coralli]MBE3002426.1 ribonuclease Z [Nocardiopsis coralli]